MIQTINKNKYKVTVDCGKVNGHRKRISKTFIGNKKDAKIFEQELIKQIKSDNSCYKKNKDLVFNDLINIFIEEYCSNNLKSNTTYGYNSLIKVVRKEIGNIKTTELTTYTLRLFYNKLKKEYNYSSNTILHYYILIGSIIDKTKYISKITNNPNKEIEKPKIIKNEASFYELEDISKLKKVLEKNTLDVKTPILLCIDTGMRREELNGLQWSDIDFNNKTISINRVRIAVGKETKIETPKTVNSRRTILVSDYSINLLKELKNEQITLYKSNNKTLTNSCFIFINEKCEPIYPDTLSKRFNKIIKNNNLKKITFHELRHTNASLLINSNIDINSVSKRLGHANVSTTLNIYTHVLDKSKEEMANKMNEILKNV